ncbi:hypothetical protein BOX15_Mlig026189g1 [Macrostomum lignano]|uniref:Protein kinase domain-containing protein n=1 Tax=Macrostomum lignano TaxID=282301 RepID=A0A267GG47_9PLAT|nr:hypothetical protein BOX15_Mlig026189g1 [Macrostomum lignano]
MPSECQLSLCTVQDLSPLLCNPEPNDELPGLTAQLQLMHSRPDHLVDESRQQKQQQQQEQHLACDLPDSWSTISSLAAAAAIQHTKSLPTLQDEASAARRCDTMIVAAEPRRSKTLFEGLLGCLRPMLQIVGRRAAVYGGAYAQVASGAAAGSTAAAASVPWTVDMLDISDLQFLTSGSQGAVFYGIYRGQEVAVKKFTEPPEVSLQELRHLRDLRHPHVVQFIGACVSDPNCNCLVMEYCPFGNLYEFYTSKVDCLPAAKVLDWCKQLASGMAYLHERKIAHGDLKSPNILVCDGDVLKISDFGLVRVPALEGAACSRQVASRLLQLYGTVRWMSPEQCRQESWGYAADVYSYGVIVWELLFQEVPYKNVDRWAVVLGVGQGTLSLPLPRHTPDTMRTLMESCWSQRAKSRPAFKTIRQSLEMRCTDVLILSDGDLRILRRAWSAEIASALSSMRQEDLRAKLEADLIRQRREELQHASDIRQHYEKKLHRVDNLQMDLTNLRLRLLLQAKATQDRSRELHRLMLEKCCRSCKQLLTACGTGDQRLRRRRGSLEELRRRYLPPTAPSTKRSAPAKPSLADASVQTICHADAGVDEDGIDSLPQLRQKPGRRLNKNNSQSSTNTANSSSSRSSGCNVGSSYAGGSRGNNGASPAMLLSTEILTRELQDNMTDSLSDKEAAFDQFKQQGGSRCSAGTGHAVYCAGARDSAATDFNLMPLNSESFEDHQHQQQQSFALSILEVDQDQPTSTNPTMSTAATSTAAAAAGDAAVGAMALHPLRRSEGCANGFRPNSAFI